MNKTLYISAVLTRVCQTGVRAFVRRSTLSSERTSFFFLYLSAHKLLPFLVRMTFSNICKPSIRGIFWYFASILHSQSYECFTWFFKKITSVNWWLVVCRLRRIQILLENSFYCLNKAWPLLIAVILIWSVTVAKEK